MEEKIREAVRLIEEGVCKRIDVSERVKVYAVKNVVRIDIKSDRLQEIDNAR